MNVYQRPLFRQAGGPIQPEPQMAAPQMAPQMAAPEAAISQAESAASEGMQQVGLDYLAQTMGGIDAATDAKGLIDALRGNNKPLEARYAELAQLVGEQDAMQTPESVLALVQPTIMMTEQGAVDSGVGELMQNIIGQVEMETEEGAPTQMAGGVGSLMMAGAPAAMEAGQQPVQNFRYGGLVQRFKTGGEAQGRLGQLYSEMLPIYQSVLGPGGSEEAKAQALFAIAQAAGQFAAGRGPQGEDLRGASPAAAFAANLGGLSGSLQQQAAARGQEERALRLAALQGAQQEYSAERAAARAAAGRERGIGDAYEAVDAEGNVIAMEFLADRAGLEAFQAANPGATIRKAAPAREAKFERVGEKVYRVNLDGTLTLVAEPEPGMITLVNPETNQILPNVPVGGDAYTRALDAGYVDVGTAKDLKDVLGAGDRSGEFIKFEMPDGTVETVRSDDPLADELVRLGGTRVSISPAGQEDSSPLGDSFNAKLLELISNPEIMSGYGSGLLDQTDPKTAARITNALTVATQAKPVWDQTLGREVSVPGMQLSETVLGFIRQRQELGLPVPTLGSIGGGVRPGAEIPISPDQPTEGRIRFNADGSIDFSSFENDPTFIITGVDLSQSQDFVSTVNRAFNFVAGQLQPILGGSGYAGDSGRITSQADTQLNRLANQIMRVIRSDTEGKVFALDATLLEKEVNNFRPSGATTDNSARDALVTTRNALASSWNDTEIILMNPALYDEKTTIAARTLQAQVERLLAETTAAIAIYDRFISSNPLEGAAADRAATSSITSTLPRASSGE
jgi:hypothetical protein